MLSSTSRAVVRAVFRRPGQRLLPLALGLSDGILNALILASAAILHSRGTITIGLVARVALVGFITSIFTVFVAEYAHLRSNIARAERELNMTRSGRLATSYLGHTAILGAVQAALIASAASFLGAMVPLFLGAAVPTQPWCAFVVAIVGLGLLGIALAREVNGHAFRWAGALVICGAIVAASGIELKIT